MLPRRIRLSPYPQGMSNVVGKAATLSMVKCCDRDKFRVQCERKDRALQDGNMGQLVREDSGEDAICVESRKHGKSRPREDGTSGEEEV